MKQGYSKRTLGVLLILPACVLLTYLTARAVSGGNPATRPAMKEINPTTQPAESCTVGENAACGVGHWKAKTDAEWRKLLTPEQYNIARQAGTERAFTGKYWNTHAKGVYQCAVCGQALFSSNTKFDSGTGWPSFFQPVSLNAVTTRPDDSLGMMRTEVLCSNCGAHLGHLFNDGPAPTGLRYCLNSAVLNLVAEKPEKPQQADSAATGTPRADR